MRISEEGPESHIDEQKIFNFFNLNTLWFLKKSKDYQNIISRKQNLNFLDSRILSMILKTPQRRGPSFTRAFFKSREAKKRRHFLIGADYEEINKISKTFQINPVNLSSYNPPLVKGFNFSDNEIKKMVSLLKKNKPEFVWVCVGSPKQEILSNKLFDSYKSKYFNVGAALDFILKKKKEAPDIISFLGLEWFYRLITDFKYSRKKVWRSFFGLRYIKNIELKDD